jgi:hypothetical protein
MFMPEGVAMPVLVSTFMSYYPKERTDLLRVLQEI